MRPDLLIKLFNIILKPVNSKFEEEVRVFNVTTTLNYRGFVSHHDEYPRYDLVISLDESYMIPISGKFVLRYINTILDYIDLIDMKINLNIVVISNRRRNRVYDEYWLLVVDGIDSLLRTNYYEYLSRRINGIDYHRSIHDVMGLIPRYCSEETYDRFVRSFRKKHNLFDNYQSNWIV